MVTLPYITLKDLIMNFLEKIGAFFDNIFGFGLQDGTAPQLNNRKDNRLRDENGQVYTTFHEEAEMDQYCDDEGIYYEEDEEYYCSSGDLNDEDIEYLREEYGDSEY